MFLGLRCTRGRELALWVVHPVAAHGAQEDRRLPGLPEKRDRQVDLAHIDETTGSDREVFETLAIRPNRAAVLTAVRHPGPMPRGQLRFCGRLEVENVERFTDARDDVGRRAALRQQTRQIQ